MKDKINILGTEYSIYTNVKEEKEPRLKENYGFCDYCTKEIFLSKEVLTETEDSMKNLKEYEDKVLRHEIIHAYLFESGLRENSKGSIAWAANEEMVDWIAIQSPKIFKTFQELEII